MLWDKLRRKGIGGQFLSSIQAMYRADYVISVVNGVSTRAVYLRRGVRQGCSLSPMLFALYVSEMGEELARSTLGVRLYMVCISALFFAVCLFLLYSFIPILQYQLWLWFFSHLSPSLILQMYLFVHLHLVLYLPLY